MRLYDHYKKSDPWDKNLPPDLIDPLKHLRKVFGENHWAYGQITEMLCYHRLHPNESADIQEYLPPLQQLKQTVGIQATQRFIELLRADAPPAIFKAFFDLYVDGVTISALYIFLELVKVGEANEPRLGVPHLEWAETQTKHMIRSQMHSIEIWVRNVCDKQPYDPNEDFEEQIFWRKWQAPMLIVMKPSRYQPYEPSLIWERLDAADSRGILEGLAEHYVVHIETRVENATGQAALELAKQPRPAPPPSVPVVGPPLDQSLGATQLRRTVTSRREAQRKTTQAKYRNWQKEYRSLKKSHPEKSDVWLSLKIARMEIAKGSSSETVRKHMKRE